MTINKKELEFDLIFLQEFGLTPEELEGYLEFFEDILDIEENKDVNTSNMN